MELQEVVDTLQEAQDYKDLETTSSAVSIHFPGQQSVFSNFCSMTRRPGRDIFAILNLNICCHNVFMEDAKHQPQQHKPQLRQEA